MLLMVSRGHVTDSHESSQTFLYFPSKKFDSKHHGDVICCQQRLKKIAADFKINWSIKNNSTKASLAVFVQFGKRKEIRFFLFFFLKKRRRGYLKKLFFFKLVS